MAHHYAGEGWSERNPIPTVQSFRAEQERLHGNDGEHNSWFSWGTSGEQEAQKAQQSEGLEVQPSSQFLSYLQSGPRASVDDGVPGATPVTRAAKPAQSSSNDTVIDSGPVRVGSMNSTNTSQPLPPIPYDSQLTRTHSNARSTSSTSKGSFLSRMGSKGHSRKASKSQRKEQQEDSDDVADETSAHQDHSQASEKQRIKDKAKEFNEPKKNNFMPKGQRRVDDPVTGGPVVIRDAHDDEIDPAHLDSRYRGGFSTRKPVEAEKYDMQYVSPFTSRPTSVLLQHFPEPMETKSFADMDSIFTTTLYGYAAVVVLVWGVATVGHGWLAFLFRTFLLGVAAAAGFMAIGLVQNKIRNEFERIRAQMHRQRGERYSPPYPESVEWLNAVISTVWKQMNPEMFISMLDQVEDIMQSSLPSFVSSVKISDFGLGENPFRFIAMRGLADLQTDKYYPRKHWIEKNPEKGAPTASDLEDELDEAPEARRTDAQDMAGDFLNMEVSFCYSAMPGQSNKDRAKNIHLLIEFFLGAFDWLEIPIPIWVQVERIIGTVRVRAQIMSEPPFLRNVTVTLMGVPNVSISAIPMLRILPNVLDLPIISGFVQSSIAAAANMYVAPKSITMDVSTMIGGDGIKKDTDAVGVLVVNIHYGQDLSSQDMNGKSDPYCVLSFAKFGRPLYSTRIIFEDLNPVWEETAFLLVSREDIRSEESLSLQLWDSDKRTADDIVGRVNLPLATLARSPNRLHSHTSNLMGFEDADEMQGQLNFSVGYFEKRDLNKALQKKPDMEHASSAEKEAARTPASTDSEQEAMALDTPPDKNWPSGVLSVIVKHIDSLDRRDVEKGVRDKDREGSAGQDVEESSSYLPSGYCEVILNDNLIYKTRVKQYNNMPFFNAGTEVFVRDWTTSELRIVVRDARLREHDPIMGIVQLPLRQLFKNASQVEQMFSLQDGVGYGKVACSMVFRSVDLKLPRELTGYNTVSVDLLSNIQVEGKTPDWEKKLNSTKIMLVAGLYEKKLGSLKKHPDLGENEALCTMPVYERYKTTICFSFGRISLPGFEKLTAIALLPLRELEDEQVTDVVLPILAGDNLHALERNFINHQTTKTHDFEEVGSLSVRVCVNPGLSEAHREALSGPRDRHEFETFERLVGLPQRAEENSHANDDGVITRDERKAINKAKTQELHMRHRGAMGYTPVRTAVWAKDGFKSHIKNFGSALFGKEKRDQRIQSESG